MKTRTISKFFFLIMLQLSITGCSSPDPVWEDTKITDLAPVNGSGETKNLKTVSFDVHKIEFPADQIDKAKEIYENLQTSPLSLNSGTGFKENLFKAGLGQRKAWDKLNQIYKKAHAEVKSSTSYIINFNQPDYVSAAFINPEKKLYYHKKDGTLKKVTRKTSNLSFRVTATEIGKRNFCRLDIVPAFRDRNQESKFEAFLKNKDKHFNPAFNISDYTIFNSAAFSVEISRGDFILIGPEKFVPHQYTLPAILFCRQQPEPMVRIYLILCKQIKL